MPEASRRLLMDRVHRIIRDPDNLPEGIRARATIGACWVFMEAEWANLRAVYEALDKPLKDLRVHRRRAS